MAIPGPDIAPILITTTLTGAVAATIVLRGPVGRALARWVDGRTDHRLGVPVEVERLQARVADLEAMQPRLAELEERLDFTERMLTRAPSGQPLKTGDE